MSHDDDRTTERSTRPADGRAGASQYVPGCPNVGGADDESCAQVPTDLNDTQLCAIASLIAGTSPGKAARACGIDRRTLYRWRYECEPFRAELDRRRREMWDTTKDRLRTMINTSLNVLAVELRDEYDMARFRAASTILRVANVRKLIEDEMSGDDRA